MRTALLCSTVITLAWPAGAQACAFAFDPQTSPPRVAGEEALIVWDAERKVEHFVRTARFQGAARSFGFLVPTPDRPEVAEADGRVFDRLARFYGRPVQHLRSMPILEGDASASVTVVERKVVAGLDAAVLKATDAAALGAWLRQHRFAARADLDAWLAPYVARGFYVTAFRYDPDRRRQLSTKAVRLSFAAAEPYYPYAEPRDARPAAGRRLRLTVVAPWRVEGRLGDVAWGARTGFAGQPRGLGGALRDTVPSPEKAGPWITTFEDVPSRRGSQDLSFPQAAAQRAVAPSIDAN
jgi:hypothetical protein